MRSRKTKRKFSCIDLFCGAGGLSEGFRQQGFYICAANDFDPYCEQTYCKTNPDTPFLSGSISNISAEAILNESKLEVGELDCLIGGPPCQAFSVYNHQRGFHDDRSHLFREYLRIVEGTQPKFVVMENVPGILSLGGGRAVHEIYHRLENLGYVVSQATLSAEQYGVPQERKRVFFIGQRLNEKPFSFPAPTHGEGLLPLVTVWDAISDLPVLQINEGKNIADYPCLPQSEYQSYLRKESNQVFNHVAPHLAPINMERLKHIPQGGSWRDVPHRLLPAGMQKARRCDHTKRYGRLHPDGLASTILTRCDLHWGAYIHPTQERTLTVREAARFQSFPDHIQFCGSRIEQFRQVGNAVPVLLASAVAKQVYRMLHSTLNKKVTVYA